MHTEKVSRFLHRTNETLLRYPLSVFLIVLVLLFIKETKQFVYPQFWCEEGQKLFADALMFHWQSLFAPYDGYLHTFPRLVANLAIYFPYRWVPAIFAYTCVAVTLFVVSRILNPRLNIPYKAFFAIMVILVPSFGEVFMSLDDTQWMLLIVLILYAFYLPPSTLAEKLTDAVVILLAGLTGPGIVFVYPILIWRVVKDRRTALWLICATLAILVQFIVTHFISVSPVAHSGMVNPKWISAFGGRFFADIFYYAWLHHVHLGFLLALIAFVFPFWVGFYLVPEQYRKQAICFCYLWLAFVVGMLVRIGSYVIGPEDFSGDRYVYMPTLLLAWLLILALNNKGKKFIIALIFLIMMIVQSAFMFPDAMKNSDRVVDYHWGEYSQKIQPGVPITIPINCVTLSSWTILLYQKSQTKCCELE